MTDPRDLPCRELVEQLTDYLEDALAPEQARLIRGHLESCDGCTAHLEQLRTAVALIGRASPHTTSAEHDRRLQAMFGEWAAGR